MCVFFLCCHVYGEALILHPGSSTKCRKGLHVSEINSESKDVKGPCYLGPLVTEFRYSGTALTNPNCIHEKIKSRLNLGNLHYHLLYKD